MLIGSHVTCPQTGMQGWVYRIVGATAICREHRDKNSLFTLSMECNANAGNTKSWPQADPAKVKTKGRKWWVGRLVQIKIDLDSDWLDAVIIDTPASNSPVVKITYDDPIWHGAELKRREYRSIRAK